MDLDEDDTEEWREFHNKTREYIVFLLFFLMLHFMSYFIICFFKKRKNGLFSGSYEDAVALRIALWICTFSLGISIASALLLPMSIISNEVLVAYPNNYYVQWLNSSLIQGMWNLVFLFSNLALFILLPFSHIFVESEGLPGSTKGVISRAYEAIIILTLLLSILMGLTYIISAIFDDRHYSLTSVFNVSNYYLPFLYSCVSFIGVLMLLICTPVGFARLFTVMGHLIMKIKNPKLAGDKKENEVMYNPEFCDCVPSPPRRQLTSMLLKRTHNIPFEDFEESMHLTKINISPEEYVQISSFSSKQSKLQKRFAWFKNHVLYPSTMLTLLLMTIVLVLVVFFNSLELCFGYKHLPVNVENLSLGRSSLSYLGSYGAALETVLILYLWGTSIFGLYSLPVFKHLMPKISATSMTQVIGNCAVLLVLSSALPVLIRSLGITNFDLLGEFGRINWLGNFYIVLFHNIVFAVTAVLCIGTKISRTLCNEIIRRIYIVNRTFGWWCPS